MQRKKKSRKKRKEKGTVSLHKHTCVPLSRLYILCSSYNVSLHQKPQQRKENHIVMSSVTQLFKNNPVNRDRIIPLDFAITKTLPDSHVWSKHESKPELITRPIPVISLSNPAEQGLLRHVCEEWGVFHITDHGVPHSLLHNVECQMKRLFSLPMHRKILAVRSPDESTGYGVVRISMFYDKLMWSEGFSVMGSSLPRHAALLWPDDHTEFW